MQIAPNPEPPPDWRTEGRTRLADKILAPDASEETRAAFSWLTLEHAFEFFVTIQFNCVLSESQVLTALKRFGAVVDHHFLGPAWSKRPSADRTFFVGTIEQGAGGNYHAHLLLHRPRGLTVLCGWREEGQEKYLTHILTEKGRRKGVCPLGDVNVRRIHEDDIERVVGYSLKQQDARWNSTGLIISTEFHRVI